MMGAAPRIGGNPDLSGIWRVQAEPGRSEVVGLGDSPTSKYFRDILADFKPGEEPLTPEARQTLHETGQLAVHLRNLRCLPNGVPHVDLLPEPFKIIQTNAEILVLFEVGTNFRQIYTDGRKPPSHLSSTWSGYSVGHWEGNILVVDTLGFKSGSWLDMRGHGHSEDLRVEERFQRRDFGHLDVSMTITDPKTFTKPVTIDFVEELLPDTDVLDRSCPFM